MNYRFFLYILLTGMISLLVSCPIQPANPYVLTEEIEYAGKSYMGIGAPTDSSSPCDYPTLYKEISISYPEVKGFEADGCFILRGGTNGVGEYQYVLIRVIRTDNANDQTSYWGKGRAFEKRIWLRFGTGDYDVTVHNMRVISNNLNYEGDINSWAYSNPPKYTFTVTNTRDEDGRFYYPSDPIQSDDSRISDLAVQLTAMHDTTHDKTEAIHDYVVTTLYYDDDSIPTGYRKKQDAITTLTLKTGVCEGYTSLFGALCRSLGIRTKCLAGSVGTAAHAWSAVDNGGEYILVDTTFDDPGPNDADPANIRWEFFWQEDFAPSDHENDGWATNERPDRGISEETVLPGWKGYPDGYY